MIDVGILIPQTNRVSEFDFMRIMGDAPEMFKYFIPHFFRIKEGRNYKINPSGYLEDIYNNIGKTLDIAKNLNLQSFSFLCTSASVNAKISGNSIHDNLKSIVLMNPIDSIIKFILKKGIKDILIISPYNIEYTNNLFSCIKDSIPHINANIVALDKNYNSKGFNSEILIRVAEENLTEKTQFLFIPCTNYDSMDVGICLENKFLNLCVSNSNQVSLWNILNDLNTGRGFVTKYGRMFEL